MECFLVVNEDHGVGRVGRRQPHGEKASDEGEEEQSWQQHVQTECGVKIKLVGSATYWRGVLVHLPFCTVVRAQLCFVFGTAFCWIIARADFYSRR